MRISSEMSYEDIQKQLLMQIEFEELGDLPEIEEMKSLNPWAIDYSKKDAN